ncbi:TetR/AcrR family transcriptional regulator [Amycolatopsis rhizosphaerae]|uniref:TetR/AcrR family transcriptional regulator n=1 Tax=Amycolatopsis rhizosphaerae TaxID=2053003 RepID=A0A558DLC1_9PSEU|nr:TetR/AcrR family transcriptional regulator [Amycolatopsis rhizosphaerae]TVT61802.1 TetR/AcrR family transcriptional regulator [Amycolatopsis rhizosphaerae]
MRGRVPPRSVDEIAEAAARVFMSKGYRAAGVSDVSAALGLSHGAVYTYAKSKEALLYLALLHLTRPESLAGLDIPVVRPAPGEIVAMVDAWAADHEVLPVLAGASGGRRRHVAVPEEFGAIIDELYAFVETNRRLLALVERCAQDLPELAQLYFVQRRRNLLAALGDYLRRRIRSGALRPVPDVAAAARFVVETVTWFAWHRIDDPDSAMLDDEVSRRTVRHLLLAAFLPEPDQAGAPA